MSHLFKSRDCGDNKLRFSPEVKFPYPIFPIAWADQLDHFLANYKFERLSGVGRFTPLEATEKFAAAIIERLEK